MSDNRVPETAEGIKEDVFTLTPIDSIPRRIWGRKKKITGAELPALFEEVK